MVLGKEKKNYVLCVGGFKCVFFVWCEEKKEKEKKSIYEFGIYSYTKYFFLYKKVEVWKFCKIPCSIEVLLPMVL